jgi:hypothetical protein
MLQFRIAIHALELPRFGTKPGEFQFLFRGASVICVALYSPSARTIDVGKSAILPKGKPASATRRLDPTPVGTWA